LVERLDLGELQTLCFCLEVDYDSLPPGGKADKARDLIAFLERRGRVRDILVWIRKHRPDISLPDGTENNISGQWRDPADNDTVFFRQYGRRVLGFYDFGQNVKTGVYDGVLVDREYEYMWR
jgi:hypothetical protein